MGYPSFETKIRPDHPGSLLYGRDILKCLDDARPKPRRTERVRNSYNFPKRGGGGLVSLFVGSVGGNSWKQMTKKRLMKDE
jgi:hypothetical protein